MDFVLSHCGASQVEKAVGDSHRRRYGRMFVCKIKRSRLDWGVNDCLGTEWNGKYYYPKHHSLGDLIEYVDVDYHPKTDKTGIVIVKQHCKRVTVTTNVANNTPLNAIQT